MSTEWFTNESNGLDRFWHPVAYSHEVEVGRPTQVTLLGTRWLVTRRGRSLVAFQDQCPHRRAPLSAGVITNEEIECPYHGWRFDLNGTCTSIPALGDRKGIPPKAALQQPAALQEHLGLVWLAPREPLTPLPEWPQWAGTRWDAWYLHRRQTHVSAGLLTENFMDATHFAFVHRNTFGAKSQSAGVAHSERNAWTIDANFHHDSYQPGLGEVEVHVTTKLHGPFSYYLLLQSPEGSRAFTFFLQPCSNTETRLYLGVACDDTNGDEDKIRAEAVFNDRVYDEDLALLEQFETPLLPLDLRREVHTTADSNVITYRRLLNDIAG